MHGAFKIDDIEDLHGAEIVEQISTDICEVLWANTSSNDKEEGEDGAVFILGVEMIDACNHAANGCFWVGGVEYGFEIRSGNNAGFEWIEVSPERVPDIKVKRTQWALSPRPDLVQKALAKGNGPFLLMKFDAIAGRDHVKDIPGKYTYDKLFAPGSRTERYWRDKADEQQMVLVDKEYADEVRSQLKGANNATAAY